jgi:hypothetical protein
MGAIKTPTFIVLGHEKCHSFCQSCFKKFGSQLRKMVIQSLFLFSQDSSRIFLN